MSESMNDERLTDDTEYQTHGRRLADEAQRRDTDAEAGANDVSTEYDSTVVGTGSTKIGTTNTTVDAGGATAGAGTTATSPGGSTTLGAGDSMDDTTEPVGGNVGALPSLNTGKDGDGADIGEA